MKELRALILVRFWSTANIPKEDKYRMPTKNGKLKDTKDIEVNSLIRVAYEVRMLPIKLSNLKQMKMVMPY